MSGIQFCLLFLSTLAKSKSRARRRLLSFWVTHQAHCQFSSGGQNKLWFVLISFSILFTIDYELSPINIFERYIFEIFMTQRGPLWCYPISHKTFKSVINKWMYLIFLDKRICFFRIYLVDFKYFCGLIVILENSNMFSPIFFFLLLFASTLKALMAASE